MLPSATNEPRTFRQRANFSGGALRLTVLAALLTCITHALAQSPVTDVSPDRRCLQCHGQSHIGELSPGERLSMVGTKLDTGVAPTTTPAPTTQLSGTEPARRPGLFVQAEATKDSVHAPLHCVECHQDAAHLPHSPVLTKANCSTACHEQAVKAFETGAHKSALDRKEALAPTCATCHGGHDIRKASDRKAPQNKLNSLHLCGDCHSKHAPSANGTAASDRINNYLDSAHARAITGAGLPMAATCSDCHSAHAVKPSKDPTSTVSRNNIPQTCGKCHVGIVEKYLTSVHGQKNAAKPGRRQCAPTVTRHTRSHSHLHPSSCSTSSASADNAMTAQTSGDRVGTYYQTYAQSYHGQVTRLALLAPPGALIATVRTRFTR
jgi:hypothetical protein